MLFSSKCIIKMDIKTNLLEEYLNSVDTTKKQTKYLKRVIFLIAIIIAVFLFFVLFNYLIEKYLFSRSNTKNR